MGETSSHEAHRREAADRAKRRAIRCAVLTVSDTRTPATDQGGDLVQRLLEEAGHAVAARDLVRDEPDMIRRRLEQWLADAAVDVILTTGGTGIARRDTTIEVVRGLLTTELEGFGELFRMLSYQRIGAAAMLSRAVAGLVAGPAEEDSKSPTRDGSGPTSAGASGSESGGASGGAPGGESGGESGSESGGASGGGTFIFALPGSLNAVETAMTELIAGQLAHLVWERTR